MTLGVWLEWGRNGGGIGYRPCRLRASFMYIQSSANQRDLGSENCSTSIFRSAAFVSKYGNIWAKFFGPRALGPRALCNAEACTIEILFYGLYTFLPWLYSAFSILSLSWRSIYAVSTFPNTGPLSLIFVSSSWCIAGLFTLLVSLFQARFWALNRRRGDAHKLDRQTERRVNTTQQCAELLLA